MNRLMLRTGLSVVLPAACTLTGVLPLLTGCSDPRAEAAGRVRLERAENLLNLAGEREAEGPRRLADMGERIEDEHQLQQELLARDVRRLREWAEFDVQRWHERQPRYRADILDALDGDLPGAWDTIPRFLY